MTRRTLLLALPALLARPARAQADRVVVLGDARQRAVLEGILPGADWVMGDAPRLLRDMGLAAPGYDLGLLPHRLVAPRLLDHLLPLDGLVDDKALADIPPALRRAFTVEGRLIGLPFGQSIPGLFTNEAVLAERRVAPPATAEALLEACRAATGPREDGTAVSGLVLDGIGVGPVLDIARIWDGDVLSPDLALRVTEPGFRRGLEVLAALFGGGVLPRILPRFSAALALAEMQQGRGAFAIGPMARLRALNAPGASRDARRISVAALPAAAGGPAPVTVAVEALVIPRSAPNRDGAIRAMQRLAGAEATLRAGLNGNGPVRLTVLADPRYAAAVPWAAAEAAVLPIARPALPPIAQVARVEEIIRLEMEAMLVRPRPVAETVERLAFRLRPLLA